MCLASVLAYALVYEWFKFYIELSLARRPFSCRGGV